ncbi:MAG: hypothetical protein ABFS30_14530, partial [Pseudomonadota bacterium]
NAVGAVKNEDRFHVFVHLNAPWLTQVALAHPDEPGARGVALLGWLGVLLLVSSSTSDGLQRSLDRHLITLREIGAAMARRCAIVYAAWAPRSRSTTSKMPIRHSMSPRNPDARMTRFSRVRFRRQRGIAA